MFERVPVTQKAMYVFVWKAMQNAKKVIDAKIGEDVVFDRYASFAHSLHMVREYALLQSTQTSTCVLRQDSKGTKYAFLGMKLRGGFSAFTDDSKHSEIIDKTQGEIILSP
jgi:hypothetical protein